MFRPLGPGCSDAELQAFAGLEEEDACGMCPAKQRFFELPNPFYRLGDRLGTLA